MLTNREIASILWSILIVGVVWWRVPGVRPALTRLAELALSRVFVFLAVLLTVWNVLIVLLAAQIGLWNGSMVKDTIISAIPSLGLLLASTKAASEDGFYRKRASAAVWATVLIEFYVGFATYDFLPEFFLIVPIASVATLILSLAGAVEAVRPLTRAAGVIAATLGLALLVPPVAHLVRDWGTIDAAQTVRVLLLPLWLTILVLPLVYVLSVRFTYEDALNQMRLRSPVKRVPWRARVALVVVFNGRSRSLYRFAHTSTWTHDLVRTTSLRQAFRIVRDASRSIRRGA